VLPIALLPAMTSAEMAQLFNGRYGLHARLHTVPMENWKRSDGNRWVRQPQFELAGAQARAMEELRHMPQFIAGWPELKTALDLSRTSDWRETRFLLNEGEDAALVLVPAAGGTEHAS
jgi:hypothetical protein